MRELTGMVAAAIDASNKRSWPKTKLCVDCAHYKDTPSSYLCTRPVGTSLVTGKMMRAVVSCGFERNSKSAQACGRGARYFLPKPPKPPKPATLLQHIRGYFRFWADNGRGRGGGA